MRKFENLTSASTGLDTHALEIAVCVPRLNILCEIPGEGVGGVIKIQLQHWLYSSAAQTVYFFMSGSSVKLDI